MFYWLAELVRWLHDFISEVPIYVAAPAMIVIGTLDSSLLSLPEINDYLVVAGFYGERVLVFIRVNGMAIMSVATSLLIVGIAVYVFANHIRAPRRSMLEQVEESKLKVEGREETNGGERDKP